MRALTEALRVTNAQFEETARRLEECTARLQATNERLKAAIDRSITRSRDAASRLRRGPIDGETW